MTDPLLFVSFEVSNRGVVVQNKLALLREIFHPYNIPSNVHQVQKIG